MSSTSLTSHSHKKAALCAALFSPSGEMNQVLTQLTSDTSTPSSPVSPLIDLPTTMLTSDTSTPSSPVSPLIDLPTTMLDSNEEDVSAIPLDSNEKGATENVTKVATSLGLTPETYLACSQVYDMFNTPSPTANSSSGAVPEESLPAVSPDVKPVVYLNLASPLDIGSDSPVNEQVPLFELAASNCSVSSLLDRGKSEEPLQNLPDSVTTSSFSEFDAPSLDLQDCKIALYPKPEETDENDVKLASTEEHVNPGIKTEARQESEVDKKQSTPIFDLSRPLTGQRAQQISSQLSDLKAPSHTDASCSQDAVPMDTLSSQDTVPMETLKCNQGAVPMEIPVRTSPGDFTLLGIEFETLAEVSVNGSRKRLKTDSSDTMPTTFNWDSTDFRFTHSTDMANPDDFGCSQLEVPFSQLENQPGVSGQEPGLGSSQEGSAGRRIESPSLGALKMRSRRAKNKITKALQIRRTVMDRVSNDMKICQKKIRSCTAGVAPQSETIYWVRDTLKSCSKLMGEIKTVNRRDHNTAQTDCSITEDTLTQLSAGLDEELGTLTQIYMTYRGAVLLLRQCCNDPGKGKKGGRGRGRGRGGGRGAGAKEVVKQESIAADEVKGGAKQQMKRKALCVVEGEVVRVARTSQQRSSSGSRVTADDTSRNAASGGSRDTADDTLRNAASSDTRDTADDTLRNAASGGSAVKPTAARNKVPRPILPKQTERGSQIIVEEFFKQQRLSIERGDNPVAVMCQEQSKGYSKGCSQTSVLGTPALPTRVRRMKDGPPCSPLLIKSNSSQKASTQRAQSKSTRPRPNMIVSPTHPASPISKPRRPSSSLTKPLLPMSPLAQNPDSQTLMQFQTPPEVKKPKATRDISTSTPDVAVSMTTCTPALIGTQQLHSYPSPLVKEIKIKNVKYRTPEQMVARVTAHRALSQLEEIHLSPSVRSQQKEVTTLGDSFSNFPVPLLEKISQDNTMMDRLSQQNSMKEKLSQENTMVVELLEDKTMRETASQRVDSTQIPCLSVPSQVNVVVDKVVKFLVQVEKVDTGLNAVYTNINNEKLFASLEEDGMVFYQNVIYKSCEHWLRYLSNGINVDALQMVHSTKTGNSLQKDMEDHWFAERAAQECNKKNSAGDINSGINSSQPDSFDRHRDGLEFFDIITILESNVEISVVSLEEYSQVKDLPPHFWFVESAGVPASLLADINDWP